MYKIRNREKILEYNRRYKKLGIQSKPNIDKQYMICAKCGSRENVQICHIKPRQLGGLHRYNIVMFCQKHHAKFDQLLREFWYV